MNTAVLPLETLIPFAAVVGLTLILFFITNVVQGYEAPKSAWDSVKKILRSTAGGVGGVLVGHLLFGGLVSSEDIRPLVLAAIVAIVILFAIDMIVLRLRSQRQNIAGDDT